MNLQNLIGLSEQEAIDLLDKNRIKFRFVSRDGRIFMVDDFYLSERVNLCSRNDKITKISLG